MANIKGDERTFTSAEEMLNAIVNIGDDLYNLETGDYVFCYNDCGSIAVYRLTRNEAARLQEEANGESWSAFLGVGGTIYDDPTYEGYNDEQTSNLDFCEDIYDQDGWIKV